MTLRLALTAAVATIMAGSAAHAGTALTAEQRRGELVFVRAEYVDKGPEFDGSARHRAHVLLDRFSRDAGWLSDQEYLLALAEIAAQADNGHDSISFSNSPLFQTLRLPVRMIWLNDRLFVARAAPQYARLVGGEVRRVGRWSPAALFSHMRRYQGGKDAYRRWNLTWMLHNPGMLHALGATQSDTALTINVRLPDGTSVVEPLAPLTASDMPKQSFPAGWIAAGLSASEVEKGWHAAGASRTDPLYLQEPDRYFRMSELPDLAALYVQFRSNMDRGDQKIGPFVDAVRQRLKASPPTNIIVDLRFDTGGDNTTNRALMQEIVRSVPGHIFVLTSSYTFSAGIASEAALIHDGGARVTVIGEEPGDRDHWWSEHEAVCLPFSKVCLDKEMGHWDLIRGCKGDPHCFSDQFDVKIKTLEPTLIAPLKPVDWSDGRDPAMEEVRRAIVTHT